MSCVFNKLYALRRDRSGVAAMEFGLIGIPFFFIMIASTDLGRYFITQHSIRTLAAEAARAMMVSCYNTTASCPLTTAQKSAVAAATPFLVPGSITWTTANQTTNAAGLRTINVKVSYPFSFIFSYWTSITSISETTSLQY